MSLFGAIDKMKNTTSDKDETRLVISVGRVMDTNDPNQMGRIRVYIPAIDRNTLLVGDLPFAMYCSPFAGWQHIQSRGPTTDALTTGPVAYGFFSVPKVGTDVVIAHLDGNPQYRIWFGALQGMYLAHTLPHGRFTFANPPISTDPPNPPGTLDGPLSSTESPIQPQYDNLTEAYTRTDSVASNDGAIKTTPRANFEWRSRGIDYQAAGLGSSQQNAPSQEISKIADDRNYKFSEPDGSTFKANVGGFTQGYAQSRIEPDIPYDPSLVDGGDNLDPQTYCLTTPGFHAWSMDDRPENCRIRIRTTSGNTVILDDTNERIYIATAEGNNWVEMDLDGSIDVYSSRRVSIHAAMDVNFTTEGSFRVTAAKGIHLTSGGDTRVTVGANLQTSTVGQTNIQSNDDISIQTQGSLQVLAGAALNLTATEDINLLASGQGAFTTGTTLNFGAIGEVIIAGSAVEIDGATPATADAASPNNADEAYLTNRVPEHEPWGRIMMNPSATDNDTGNYYQLELDYDSPDVGKLELGEKIPRNPNWHR